MYRGGYQEEVPVITSYDDYDGDKAKQRASVRWLVAKAYNYQVPANLREPYYRDQTDGVERLKPQIVHALANAELYCSCLANIYADPNYHSLSHWGVIQALARKGVYVAEPSDVALTETVLIQTGPIKMSAHLAVVEAIMALYIRELITAERVVGVVRRFTALQPSTELPADQEEALLLWINKACARLRGQIAAEVRQEDTVPRFPLQQDISDLSDGTCLAGLVALYCPDELGWPEIAFAEPPRIADSLYNLQLVERFCREALPHSPHFLTLEDILYMHSSVKQNLLVLLADLFYLFEINPAKCVRQPGAAKDRPLDNGRRPEPAYSDSPRRSQPELRRDSLSRAGSVSAAGRESPGGPAGSRRPQSMYQPADDRSTGYSRDDRSNSEESEFVVQRASGPLTLSRLAQHQRRSQSPPSSVHSEERPAKERLNRDAKWQERGEERRPAAPGSDCGDGERPRPAGKPSPRSGSSGGRLSRRGSFSEESQLTVENFGGSQDRLQLLGRNPDKQPAVHRGRRESSAHRDLLKESTISFGDRDPFQEAEQERAASRSASRASLYDRSESRPERPPSRNLFQGDSIREHFQAPSGRADRGQDTFRPIDAAAGTGDIDNRVLDALEREARGESPAKADNNLVIMFDNNDDQRPTSFAELGREPAAGSGINIVYTPQQEKEDRGKPAPARSNGSSSTTDWVRQQQQQQQQQQQRHGLPASEGVPEPALMASELHSIKLRLEQKRRHIEQEKRRMESALNRQKQSVGKQAFLQAVGQAKPRPAGGGSSGGSVSDSEGGTADRPPPAALDPLIDSVEGLAAAPATLQEVSQNLSHLKDKWSGVPDSATSPDLDNLDYDQYTSSLKNMDASLTELQEDIQRLSQQQSQMQQMQHLMQNGAHTQQPAYQPAYPAAAAQYQPAYPGTAAAGQFYLHEQQPGPARRQWGPPEELYQQQQQHMSPGRARWGQPVRPVMPPAQYGGADPYGYPAPPPQHHPRPFLLHEQGPPPGAYHGSPQHHHRLDGGMAAPPHGYHPDYGYQQSPPAGHYPPAAPAPAPAPGGFRLHGRDPRADPPTAQSPRLCSAEEPRRSAERPRRRSPSPAVLHAPLPAPPLDDMAPQSVSFIGEQAPEPEPEREPVRPPRRAERSDREASPALAGGGSRTYRVPRPGGQAERSPGTSGGSGGMSGGSGGTFKVRRSPSPQRRGSPAWAGRRSTSRGGSQSPATPAAATEAEEEEQPSPEVLAAMKVDKIKQDADPEMGFVISFDDNAAPRKPKPRLGQRRTPAKAASSGSLLDQARPDVPPKPKLSAFSPSTGSGGGQPSAFSTYTKWPRRPPEPEPEQPERRSSSPSPARSPSPSPGGGLSLGRLSDPRRRTAPPPDEPDRAAVEDRPLLEKLEVDPSLPPETMKPLRPAQPSTGVGLVIGDELVSPKSEALDEMERKKERILMMSLKRKQQQEAARIRKEEDAQRKKEEEARKDEEKQRKKDEEKARKERIFEQYKLKKAIEEAEKNGTPVPAAAQAALAAQQAAAKPAVRPRPKPTPSKPRPKSMMDGGGGPGTPSRSAGPRGSQTNLHQLSDKGREAGAGGSSSQWGSSASLASGPPRSRRGSNASLYGESRYNRSTPVHSGRKAASNEPAGGAGLRKDGHRTSTGSLSSTGRPRSSRMGSRAGSSGSLYDDDAGYRRTAFTHSGRRQSGTPGGTPRYSETDSGLGRDTPTRRGVSPAAYGGVTSPSGPGSLPPGLVSRRRPYADDAASDTSSMASYDYNGPRLFKQASAKSNRSILLNAVEYCVFPGAVNREAKQRVLEEIARVEARHFLILFRDARCQFRALYCYEPETEEVFKLYGTGPKMATDKMFDKFFKYNSGGKSFTQIHTKHLSVTIDAFTIHDALWQGKRPSLPSKKDMTLVT